MANKQEVPIEVENLLLSRDKSCVYCGVTFTEVDKSRKTKQPWEHIVNDIRINGIDNIAFCCMSCNASKDAKLLEIWLESKCCNEKGITKDSVAQVVKEALDNQPKLQ